MFPSFLGTDGEFEVLEALSDVVYSHDGQINRTPMSQTNLLFKFLHGVIRTASRKECPILAKPSRCASTPLQVRRSWPLSLSTLGNCPKMRPGQLVCWIPPTHWISWTRRSCGLELYDSGVIHDRLMAKKIVGSSETVMSERNSLRKSRTGKQKKPLVS